MKILDATAGFKGIWYQKNHPFVTSEWKDAPFPNNHFDMVIFDPPHLIKKEVIKECSLHKSYGYLKEKTWKQEIKQGVRKLFDVLKPNGVFIFKWCENSIKVEEVIKLFPYKPMFGINTKSKGHTANWWILFIKHKLEKDLNQWSKQSNDFQETK